MSRETIRPPVSEEAPRRSAFPILEEKIYLASHSLGAVPRPTKQALEEYYDAWAAEGLSAWDGPWWEAVERFNASIADLLNAPEGTIAPMQNATRAMGAVASALEPGQGRSKIVMTELEFTTSYPLWRGLEDLGAEVEIVESPDGITVPTQKLLGAIDDDTLIVPTCHVYFRSGAMQDLEAVTERAHEVGAYVLGDVYQSAGTVPIDVQAMGIDMLVGGSHKWLCGGPGAGFLYVREDVVTELTPRLRGWFGLEDPFAYEPDTGRGTPAEGARRFLGGTPNVPGLYAAREGIDIVREVGTEAIRERSLDLTDRILVHADAQDLEIRTPREKAQRGGMVCVDFDGAEQATEALAERDIVVDWRPDCGIRISPHFYNTEAEIDELFNALTKLR